MSLREWLMGKKSVDGYFHRACLLEEHHGPISKENTGSDTFLRIRHWLQHTAGSMLATASVKVRGCPVVWVLR